MGFLRATIQYSEIDELYHVKLYYSHYYIFERVVGHSFQHESDAKNYLIKERTYMNFEYKDNLKEEDIEENIAKE